MDPLRPAVSILLALWAPLPSSHGLAVVQGPDAVHEVLDGAGAGPPDLGAWLSAARPSSRGPTPSTRCSTTPTGPAG